MTRSPNRRRMRAPSTRLPRSGPLPGRRVRGGRRWSALPARRGCGSRRCRVAARRRAPSVRGFGSSVPGGFAGGVVGGRARGPASASGRLMATAATTFCLWVMETETDDGVRCAARPRRWTTGAPCAVCSTQISRGATPCRKPIPRALKRASLAANRPARNSRRRSSPRVSAWAISSGAKLKRKNQGRSTRRRSSERSSTSSPTRATCFAAVFIRIDFSSGSGIHSDRVFIRTGCSLGPDIRTDHAFARTTYSHGSHVQADVERRSTRCCFASRSSVVSRSRMRWARPSRTSTSAGKPWLRKRPGEAVGP